MIPWDPRMAAEAAVADQCVKLGGVVLHRERRAVGFVQDVKCTSSTAAPTPTAVPTTAPITIAAQKRMGEE